MCKCCLISCTTQIQHLPRCFECQEVLKRVQGPSSPLPCLTLSCTQVVLSGSWQQEQCDSCQICQCQEQLIMVECCQMPGWAGSSSFSRSQLVSDSETWQLLSAALAQLKSASRLCPPEGQGWRGSSFFWVYIGDIGSRGGGVGQSGGKYPRDGLPGTEYNDL